METWDWNKSLLGSLCGQFLAEIAVFEEQGLPCTLSQCSWGSGIFRHGAAIVEE
jgi:hypothetical protein